MVWKTFMKINLLLCNFMMIYLMSNVEYFCISKMDIFNDKIRYFNFGKTCISCINNECDKHLCELDNPDNPDNPYDLELMEPYLNFLEKLLDTTCYMTFESNSFISPNIFNKIITINLFTLIFYF